MFRYALLDQTGNRWWTDSAATLDRFLEAERALSPRFCAAWNLGGMQGRAIRRAEEADPDELIFSLVPDNPAVPGAFAFHDERDGRPFGQVLVGTVLDAGGGILRGGALGASVLSTWMHELWEAAINPYVDALVLAPAGWLLFKEVADPVQAVPLPVRFADGSEGLGSDAVFPRYFDGQTPADGTEPLCLSGTPIAPFGILPEGYQTRFLPDQVKSSSGPYVTVWGHRVPPAVRAAKMAGGRLRARVAAALRSLGHPEPFWPHVHLGAP